MQIREVVLYGYNGKIRKVPFTLGSVNIITGRSKSGKSALGDIIDYCLGGESCNIADGVVREKIAWYGILLQFDSERIFIARKNPEFGQQTTNICYINRGINIESPRDCNFVSNINVSGLEEELSRRVGILENEHTPPEGQSRPSLIANIRHALFYCFQGQDEIAAKNFLFHRQSEDHITQAIKDTMSYFLGAISEDALKLENERTILRRKLILEKRKYEETRNLIGGGLERATALLGEATAVGLIDSSAQFDCENFQEIYTVLKSVLSWKPNTIALNSSMDKLTFLQNELEAIHSDIQDIDFKLDNARKFIGDSKAYYIEANHQKDRLESIGLFDALDFNPGKCPLCSGILESPLPSVEMMKAAIVDLDESIASIEREQPRLREYIASLEQERAKKQERTHAIELEIGGIYKQEGERKRLQDLNARRAKVAGKIELWLESISIRMDDERLIKTIVQMENRLKEIDDILDRNAVEERRQSALARIQTDMTDWAKELDLEHSENPYRLDYNRATVIVDKPDRPVPLKQLGSGSNWVGVHIITYLALHKYFINANRPVPKFLFLDQPSQVYFPSSRDEKEIDWNEVSKIYRFIIKRTIELNGQLQVIIVDHANFESQDIKQYICENWWPIECNLVPCDW